MKMGRGTGAAPIAGWRPPVDDRQPAGQRTVDVHGGDLDPEVVQPGVGDQAVAQPVQAVAPAAVVAEVVQTGGRAGLLHEAVRVEPVGGHEPAPRRTVVRTTGAAGLSSQRTTTNPR